MGLWEAYVLGREAERFERAPKPVQIVYAIFVALVLGAVIVWWFFPHTPNDGELSTAVEIGLISGAPRPIDLLLDRTLQAQEEPLLGGAVHRISMGANLEDVCKVESLEADALYQPFFSKLSSEGKGKAILLLTREGRSKRVQIAFRWRWENRCTRAGNSRNCHQTPVVSKVFLPSDGSE